MKKEEMLSKIIRKYGFESKVTIYFASLIEAEELTESELVAICDTLTL